MGTCVNPGNSGCGVPAKAQIYSSGDDRGAEVEQRRGGRDPADQKQELSESSDQLRRKNHAGRD